MSEDETAGSQSKADGLELPTLSRTTHDRAAQHREDADWLELAWEDGAEVLLLGRDMSTPVREDLDGNIELALKPSRQVDAFPEERTFLGEADGKAYFAAPAKRRDDTDTWAGLRSIGTSLSDLHAGLITSAIGLAEWHARHTHCPRCGTPTDVTKAGWTRTCPSDHSEHFPRTDAAVIMLVHDDQGRVVLGRQTSWGAGRYSVLAGFVEPGESLEGAVAREVFEEVGLQLTDITYIASQPWPFPASLMVGFHARVVDPDALAPDGNEIEQAAWFTKDELRAAAQWGDTPGGISAPVDRHRPGGGLAALPGRISIARLLIDKWLAQ
jgi:NAD+ diphosphatase